MDLRGKRQADNPAVRREPDLLPRAAAWHARVTDVLLDRLAARDLRNPDFRRAEGSHPLEDIVAAAQVLRVLAKPAWSQEDLALFDAYFPAAARSEAFPDEFEEARHRILSYVREARQQLAEPQARGSGGR